MKTLNELQEKLESVQARDSLLGTEYQDVIDLLDMPGLWHLLSLLLGEKQARLMALASVPLGEESMRHRASVLQGEAKGVDRLRYTLLELFQTAKEKEKEQ